MFLPIPNAQDIIFAQVAAPCRHPLSAGSQAPSGAPVAEAGAAGGGEGEMYGSSGKSRAWVSSWKWRRSSRVFSCAARSSLAGGSATAAVAVAP